MKNNHASQSAFFNLRTAFVLLLCAAACCIVAGRLMAFFRSDSTANASQRMLTFAERVAYQRAIEEVYWRHRVWPTERPDPKPPLNAVMSQAQLERKVDDYLRESQALEDELAPANHSQTVAGGNGSHGKAHETVRGIARTL
jgi:hypothetical protein